VLGNMLSAGVMVSAGFCHLLGEALKQMPHMQVGGWAGDPAPLLCACLQAAGAASLAVHVLHSCASAINGAHSA
jgi:hypothetical protein